MGEKKESCEATYVHPLYIVQKASLEALFWIFPVTVVVYNKMLEVHKRS